MPDALNPECRRVVRRLEDLSLDRLEAASSSVREALAQLVALEANQTGCLSEPPSASLDALPSALAAVAFDALQEGVNEDAIVVVFERLRSSLP